MYPAAILCQRTIVALSFLLLVPGCVSIGPSRKLAAPNPVFVPQAFFAGRTVGEGSLRVVLSRARLVHVVGDGRIGSGDALTLSQRVEEGGKPRNRTWRLRPGDGGRLIVSLSDATGPVAADVIGNRLHVRFRAKGGLRIEQWIYLQPDGQSAQNRMVVRKFGLPVAALRETIRRMP